MTSTLPRRACFGIELDPNGCAFSDAGMRVGAALPGSMAANGGIAAGDVVVSIGGIALSSPDALAEAARVAGRSTEVSMVVTRGGARFEVAAVTQTMPIEQGRDVQVALGQLEMPDGSGARLLLARPSATHPAKATVLMVQGISCASIDTPHDTDLPWTALAHRLAQLGVSSVRVDKPGAGDSQGGPPSAVDFAAECEMFRRALASLLANDDARRVFIFGHSVGGMIAPLLARAHNLGGVVVYGTSARPWAHCILASTRRQLTIRGLPAAAVEARVEREQELIESILRSDGAREAGTARAYGRSHDYLRQLHAVDLANAWRAVTAPVLMLRGEYDWVVGGDDTDAIALAARATPPAPFAVESLAGLDHAMTRHDSESESVLDYGQGRLDDGVASAVTAWIDGELSSRSPRRA